MIHNRKFIIKLIVTFLILFTSLSCVNKFSSYELYEDKISYIDEKKTTVLEISASAAIASSFITLLPNDTATPIAEKIANISEYSLGVLAILYAEKYLITLLPWIVLKFMIPIACILYIIGSIYSNINNRKSLFENIAYGIGIIGILLLIIMPCSIGVSQQIERTYDNQIADIISEAEKSSNELYQYEENGNIINTITSAVTGTVKNIINELNVVANKFIEAIGIMIVTCFLIPVITALILLGLAKMSISMICKYTNNDSRFTEGDHLNNIRRTIIDKTGDLRNNCKNM